MTRVVAVVALVAASFTAVPVLAAQDLPPSPAKLIAEPGSCPSGYDDRGYLGPEGTRWRICTIHGYELPPV